MSRDSSSPFSCRDASSGELGGLKWLIAEASALASQEWKSAEEQLTMLTSFLPIYHLTLAEHPYPLDSPNFWGVPPFQVHSRSSPTLFGRINLELHLVA